jgi:hypothetical protein
MARAPSGLVVVLLGQKRVHLHHPLQTDCGRLFFDRLQTLAA